MDVSKLFKLIQNASNLIKLWLTWLKLELRNFKKYLWVSQNFLSTFCELYSEQYSEPYTLTK